MRFSPYPVKNSTKRAQSPPNSSHWLDGWALIFPSVGIALLATWLALPQGTMPDYLPLPLVSEQELGAARQQIVERASITNQQPLDYSTRAVGESFRQLGRLAHGGEPISVDRRDRFRSLVEQARVKSGDSSLDRLRAVQTRLFLDAIASWERTGLESADFIELGANFLAVATELGWVSTVRRSGVATRRLRLEDEERAALFLTRWSDLAGVTEVPSLRLSTVWPMLALRARLRLPLAALGERDLKLVDRVKRLLPDYPSLLSQGLIYVQVGDRARAIEAFQAHLQAYPDGPYALRARNHLVYALNEMKSDGIR